MNKIKTFIKDIRNDGTDPRKNDLWRILLFALNNSAGVSIVHVLGKWSYYTQNVLMLGAFLAAVVLPMRLLDAVTDPIIANWFDKFESKWGKFRPAMLFGALLSFFPALVIFLYPVNPDIPVWASYVILISCYAIIVIGNTILMTATRAGQAVITQAPKQRPVYALGQAVFDGIIMALVSLIISGDLIGKMQDAKVWRIAVLVLSSLSIVLVFIAMKAIETRDNPKYYKVTDHDVKPRFKDFFSLIKTNKPLRRLLWTCSSASLAASVRATMSIYLFANIIMRRSLAPGFEIVSGIVIGVPFIVLGIYFASKKGSAYVYTTVSKFQTAICFLGFAAALILLPKGTGTAYQGLTYNVIIVLLLFGIYMSSLGISTNLINAMTGDLSDYEHSVSGRFIPGTIGATITFINKVVSSTVGLITMGIMLFSGFKGIGENAVVPENVFINDRFYYSVLLTVFILPGIGHLITWIAMHNYPLTDSRMKEITLEIAKKRESSGYTPLYRTKS
jgi:Na+/melibiose symporter-like transporter